MKNIILYALLFFVFTSCTSEKILKIKKLKYDWYINDIASQDNGKLRPYNLNNNLKNRFIQNQIEAQSILSSVEENQDFLASKDKTKPSVLTSNYTYKKLPQIIQNDTINKSFNEKPQIFENEQSTIKKSKIKNNINKILWIIGTALMISLTSIITFLTVFLFNFLDSSTQLIWSSLSALSLYLSYKFVMKTIDAFSSDNNKDDVKESNSKDNNKDDKMKKLLLLLLLSLFSIALLDRY